MDPIIKERWVKALRSGEYQQHRGALSDPRDRKCLCCIGVGFAVRSNEHIEWSMYDTGMASYALGLSAKNETILVTMNDEGGKDFAEIADYIEEHL